MAPPSVIVIVVNWNGLKHLPTCLHSLARTAYPNTRVLVVDNNSNDGSQEYVSKNFPRFALLQNERNLGFAGGNNAGMEYALENGAKYVVLLNNDTRVDPDWLDALVGAAEQDTTVGLCAGQQRTWDGERCIRFVYRPEWAEGEMILEPVVQDIEPRPVAFGSGCCLLARASVLREIGTFDPRYFAGVEDIDLSLRAWIAGYEVLSVPQAVVFHRISASSEPAQRRLWGYRNQLYTLLKNYEVSTLRRFAQPILRRWLLTRNRVALRATCMVLADIHTTVQLRCVTQQTRRCSDTEIFDAAGVLYV